LTYEQIKALLSNIDNTNVITYTRESDGQVPYTHNYTGYTILQPTIGVGEGEYTITLNQPNLQQKYEELRAENEHLKADKVALEQRVALTEGCILELSEVIYATETAKEGGE
jgi:FtsZ-binding cell division protein ZapB